MYKKRSPCIVRLAFRSHSLRILTLLHWHRRHPSSSLWPHCGCTHENLALACDPAAGVHLVFGVHVIDVLRVQQHSENERQQNNGRA